MLAAQYLTMYISQGGDRQAYIMTDMAIVFHG